MTNMPINVFLGATCVSVFSGSATSLSKKLWEVCIQDVVTNCCCNIRLNVSFIYSFWGRGEDNLYSKQLGYKYTIMPR